MEFSRLAAVAKLDVLCVTKRVTAPLPSEHEDRLPRVRVTRPTDSRGPATPLLLERLPAGRPSPQARRRRSRTRRSLRDTRPGTRHAAPARAHGGPGRLRDPRGPRHRQRLPAPRPRGLPPAALALRGRRTLGKPSPATSESSKNEGRPRCSTAARSSAGEVLLDGRPKERRAEGGLVLGLWEASSRLGTTKRLSRLDRASHGTRRVSDDLPGVLTP